jgi:hypothetical protein
VSQGPQYTSCVEAADFSTPSTAIIAALGALIVVGGIAALFSAGIGALIAIASLVQLLRYVLDFMLNGKLICLHRTSADCKQAVADNQAEPVNQWVLHPEIDGCDPGEPHDASIR